jgi:hypothetical protein
MWVLARRWLSEGDGRTATRFFGPTSLTFDLGLHPRKIYLEFGYAHGENCSSINSETY